MKRFEIKNGVLIDCIIYECEVGEKIESDGVKTVTNRIKPIKRLYREDVIRILNGGE